MINKHKVFYEVNEVRKYSSDLFSKQNKLINTYKRIKFSFSEKLTKYFAGIICISTKIEKYFSKYNSNTIQIPILSNINSDDISSEKNEYIKDDVFKIGFFGSVAYEKENFEQLFKSLSYLISSNKSINIIVEFYGPLDKRTNSIFELKIKEFNLNNNLYYKGIIEQKQVIVFMKKYHLLILPRGNNLQNRYGFSTKLSEYLVSGVPCLITAVSDNSKYIKDGYNGFIIPPDDINAFVNKLLYIITHYNSFENIGYNAISTVKKHFYYKNYSNKMLEFLYLRS